MFRIDMPDLGAPWSDALVESIERAAEQMKDFAQAVNPGLDKADPGGALGIEIARISIVCRAKHAPLAYIEGLQAKHREDGHEASGCIVCRFIDAAVYERKTGRSLLHDMSAAERGPAS